MPQMSPMMWLIFPFFMVVLVLTKVVTLNGEVIEEDKGGDLSGKGKLKIEW